MDNFNVTAKNGGIVFKSDYHRGLFKQRLEQLEDKKFTLTVDESIPTRSEQQNRYYWLYIKMISDETGFTKDEVHLLCKGKFLTREIKEVLGDKVRITKSTTELTKSEFAEYIQEIQTFTGITPPDTDAFFYGE